MAFETRDYAGGAAPTTLTGSINSTALSISIASSTGWPSGGASGPFFVVIDRGLAGEEKVEVQSRTGTTLTVASVGKRGVDGTSATSHALGATIEHCFTAQDADEANSHITNVALDHHTQYLNTTRHDVTARHDIGSVIPATGTPTTIVPDASASNGVSENVARVDHTHALPAATAVTSGLANAEGVSTSVARADHTHDLAALSVNTPELVDLAVTSAKLGADAVIAGKIAAGGVSQTADIADAIVTLAKFASEGATDYSGTVTFTNPTGNYVQGTGGAKTAFWFSLGRLNIMLVHFTLGTGGNITAGADIEISLPEANNASFRGFCAARARTNAGVVWSGTGVVAVGATAAVNFATAGTSANWSSTAPFNWDAGDSLDGVVLWVAAA